MTLASAQQRLTVTSSLPLPADLAQQHDWEPGMVRCGSDGNVTVLRRSHHELVTFGLNAAVVGRIDFSGLSGLSESEVVSFAPGPEGEIYVLANHVTFVERSRPDPSKPPLRQKRSDGVPTLLRFDRSGEVIFSKRMTAFLMPWTAVFDSGDFLLFDAGSERPLKALLYSKDASLLKTIDLSGAAPDSEYKRAHLGLSNSSGAYLFASHDRAFLVSDIPKIDSASIAVISSEGQIISSVVLKFPPGFSLGSWPKLAGEHLFIDVRIKAGAKLTSPLAEYAEFDTSTGTLLEQQYVGNGVGHIPACQTAEGMSFFNPREQSLEVMAPVQQKDE